MQAPRLTGCRGLAPLLGLVLGLLSPAMTRAADFGQDGVGERREAASGTGMAQAGRLDEDEEETPRIPPILVRTLLHVQIMLTTMAGAPPDYRRPPVPTTPPPRPRRWAPPAIPTPLVVKSPIVPQDVKPTPPDNPPPPQHSPEPGTLLSGLLGSGMALAAWARKRRRKRLPAEDVTVGPPTT